MPIGSVQLELQTAYRFALTNTLEKIVARFPFLAANSCAIAGR